MAIKTQAQLEAQAAIIRDEVASKANTANRLGVMIIDFLQSIYDSAATGVDITAAIDALKAAVPADGDTLNKLFVLIQDLDAKIQPPVAKNYIDTAAMIADQLVLPQISGNIYSVGTYPSLDYYEYLGTTVGDITDYSLIGDTFSEVFRTKIEEDKLINAIIRFIDATETFEISSNTDFKIDTVVPGTGITATLKESDGITDYILSATVLADDYLILSVDIAGNVKINGSEL